MSKFRVTGISIWVLGLLQAAGVVVYGFFIISSAFSLEKTGPIMAPVVAVLSVLVAGMCTLARPLYLFFFAKEPREAFMLIGWTILWLALLVVVVSLANANLVF